MDKVYCIKWTSPKIGEQYWSGKTWSSTVKKYYRIRELKLALHDKKYIKDDPEYSIEEYIISKTENILTAKDFI